jgi:uncharacterized protein YjbI with pentapeptide repeats
MIEPEKGQVNSIASVTTISSLGKAMRIAGRFFLLAATTLTALQFKPVLGKECRRVSQPELDEAIRLHAMWLADINSGRRCMFGGRDLSGLVFGRLDGDPINLSGADFVQANLSGTEADDLLVHHCNFNGARFDECHWRRPVFAFADMRRASAKRVRWGKPMGNAPTSHTQADLSHAVLTDSNLTGAQIYGYFYGTRLGDSTLARADLSNSEFLGPKHHDMRFSGANLSEANFSGCRFSSVSFFRADCSWANFSSAVLSDARMKECDLSGACFRGAELSGLILSDVQMSQIIR